MKKDLWGHCDHRTHLFFKRFSLFLEYLSCKAKISHFQDTIMHKNIRGFDISMHEIMFVQFLESIQYLWEIVTDIKFVFYLSFVFKFCEVIIEISLVTKFKHDKNLIFFPGDVLNLDNMLILPQLYQCYDLLPWSSHNMFDCFYLCVLLRNFYDF